MQLNRVVVIFFVLVLIVFENNKAFSQDDPISSFFPDIEVLISNKPAEGYFFMGSKGLPGNGASHYIAIVDNFGTPVFLEK